jgi:hypothetical protein
MGRRTTVLGFSVAPEVAKEYERLTARAKTTKSELFRRMLESYKVQLEEEEFFRLQRRMSRRAAKRGGLTEREVEQIIFVDRE